MSRASFREINELTRFQTASGSYAFPASAALASGALSIVGEPETETMVSAQENNDHIIVTVQGEGVKLYNIVDNKCVQAWAFPPDVRFTHSAVYLNHASSGNRYIFAPISHSKDISAQDRDRVIWRWKDQGMESAGLKTRDVYKIQHAVFAIDPSFPSDSHLLVIHKHNHVSLCDAQMDVLGSAGEPADSKEKTIWYQSDCLRQIPRPARRRLYADFVVDASISSANDYLVSLVTVDYGQDGQEPVYKLSLYFVQDKKSRVRHLYSLYLPLRSEPVSLAFNTSTAILYAVYAGGDLASYACEKETDSDDQRVMAPESTRVGLRGLTTRLSGLLPSSGNTSIQVVSNDHLLVVGPYRDDYDPEKHNRKVAPTTKYTALLLDVQYGIVLASCDVSLPPEVKHAVGSLADVPVVCSITPIPKIADPTESELARCLVSVASPISIATAGEGSKAATSRPKDKGRRKSKSVSSSPLGGWTGAIISVEAFVPPTTLLEAIGQAEMTSRYLGPMATVGSSDSSDGDAAKLTGQAIPQALRFPNNFRQPSKDFVLPLESAREEAIQAETRAIAALSDPVTIPDGKEFVKAFNELVGSDWQAKLTPSLALVSVICCRCFAAQESRAKKDTQTEPLWFAPVLRHLIESQHISNSMVEAPGLLPSLWTSGGMDAISLINLALENVTDIPEADMVSVLVSILEAAKGGGVDVAKSPELRSYLSRLVQTAVTPTLMRQHLTRLDPDQIQTVMLVLLNWLQQLAQSEAATRIIAVLKDATSHASDEHTRLLPSAASNSDTAQCPGDMPDLPSLIDFISLVLDSHMSMWVLTSSCYPIIGALSRLLAQLRREADIVESLRSVLAPFHQSWKESAAKARQQELEEAKRLLGLDEVVNVSGLTRIQAEKRDEKRPPRHWERLQQLDQYRVEIIHWR